MKKAAVLSTGLRGPAVTISGAEDSRRRDLKCAQAERLAREAVGIGGETDMVDAQGNTYMDLAEVLALAGRREEAAAEVEKALALYVPKGNLVMAERAGARLNEFRGISAAQETSE